MISFYYSALQLRRLRICKLQSTEWECSSLNFFLWKSFSSQSSLNLRYCNVQFFILRAAEILTGLGVEIRVFQEGFWFHYEMNLESDTLFLIRCFGEILKPRWINKHELSLLFYSKNIFLERSILTGVNNSVSDSATRSRGTKITEWKH